MKLHPDGGGVDLVEGGTAGVCCQHVLFMSCFETNKGLHPWLRVIGRYR